MKRIWTNRSGSGFPLTVAIVLAILILSCAIYEYLRLSIIASGVRDAVQSAIIAVATENYSNVYAGLRQGYSGGFSRASSRWTEQVSTGRIYPRLSETLGLAQQGNQYVKGTGDQIEYTLSGLSVTILNTPFAPDTPGNIRQFTAQAVIHLEVPLSFGWSHLPPIKPICLFRRSICLDLVKREQTRFAKNQIAGSIGFYRIIQYNEGKHNSLQLLLLLRRCMIVKRKALLLAVGILIVGVIGIWTISGSSDPNSEDTNAAPIVTPTATTIPDVNVLNLSPSPTVPLNSPSPSPVLVPDITQLPVPSDAPVLQPEKEKKQVEVSITQPEKTSKPTEPPKPKEKVTDKPQTPASTPKYEVKDTEPNKKTDEPKAGDKNSKGQVYFPGFGWVEDQGGGTQGTTVGNDGDELTGNKVGSMD
ncbi:DUF6550 family protein [Paenibacillus sp. S150]|uniref:DUF6550 family protein n=1 Tax=Paenibacillus sp. S150 TaxID=2749826 RepID=UPI001C5A0B17|nr:DUF6550 family protein [Paenibacillus sp. S150]